MFVSRTTIVGLVPLGRRGGEIIRIIKTDNFCIAPFSGLHKLTALKLKMRGRGVREGDGEGGGAMDADGER